MFLGPSFDQKGGCLGNRFDHHLVFLIKESVFKTQINEMALSNAEYC